MKPSRQALPAQIQAYAAAQAEGAVLSAKALLHMGSRAAVDQALGRLVRRGELLRTGRGLYTRPVATRFGARAPSPEALLEQYARASGQTIVPGGAAAANVLGLSTQVPVRPVYLTSGRSRALTLGALKIELQHAPAWQLSPGDSPTGQSIRALAYLGPGRARAALPVLESRLSREERQGLLETRHRLPSWMAAEVSRLEPVSG
jgi:hypothetical protein